jgi:hypothetical protein
VAGPLAEALFWIAAVATAIAQSLILRSTIRGMRATDPRARGVWEWVWAILPAAALAGVFVWTWYVMHPGAVNVMFPADRIGGTSS